MVMYSCTKFQFIWKTSDFGTKFSTKKYELQFKKKKKKTINPK